MVKLFTGLFLILFILTLVGCNPEDNLEKGQLNLPTIEDVELLLDNHSNILKQHYSDTVSFEYIVDGVDMKTKTIKSAPANADIKISINSPRVLNFEQDLTVREAIRNLFSAFSKVIISINEDNIALPTHANIIAAVEAAGGTNVYIISYSVGAYYVPNSGNLTPMPANSSVSVRLLFNRSSSLSDDIVRNAVRNLFNNFTGEKTMNIFGSGSGIKSLPTHSEIINRAQGAGATNVIITYYTAGGVAVSNSVNPGSVSSDTIINLRITYTNTSDSNTRFRMGWAIVGLLFENEGFLNNSNTFDFIEVGNAIGTARLPTRDEIINAVVLVGGANALIYTYTAGGGHVSGGLAQLDTGIVIRLAYANLSGFASEAIVRNSVTDLFREFTGTKDIITIAIGAERAPIPTWREIIRTVEVENGRNINILTYKIGDINISNILESGNSTFADNGIELFIIFDRTGSNPTNDVIVNAVSLLFQYYTGNKNITAFGINR